MPPAAKPQSTIFGYGRGMVRRDGLAAGGATANVWGNGGAASPSMEEQVEEEGKKKKGNKGKKQVLMNWG